jgi:hypothetical protein
MKICPPCQIFQPDSAVKCPKCGQPLSHVTPPQQKSSFGIGGMLLIVIGVIVAGAFISGITDHSASGPDDIEAYVMAKQFVSNRLVSPGSAKFGESWESKIQNLGNARWQVAGFVDSQNRMGALVRSEYVCTMRYEGGPNKTWRAESVDVVSR